VSRFVPSPISRDLGVADPQHGRGVRLDHVHLVPDRRLPRRMPRVARTARTRGFPEEAGAGFEGAWRWATAERYGPLKGLVCVLVCSVKSDNPNHRRWRSPNSNRNQRSGRCTTSPTTSREATRCLRAGMNTLVYARARQHKSLRVNEVRKSLRVNEVRATARVCFDARPRRGPRDAPVSRGMGARARLAPASEAATTRRAHRQLLIRPRAVSRKRMPDRTP
jgi:hypothetical protein